MYMLGENPFLSDPNINKVRKALAALEFLVVQDIFLTETAEFADVILPASSFLEKNGTYTNTDRRVQVGARRSTRPARPGSTGRSSATSPPGSGYRWDYDSPREIFDEMVSVIPSYANLTYDNLGPGGKLCPCPDPEHGDGTVVLFGERFNTDDGLAHLVPAEWLPAKELPDEEYPFVLNTGRMLEHWHTGLDDAPVLRARRHRAEAVRVRAPGRRRRLGLADGDLARVSSRRGAIELEVSVSHREARGSCSSRSTSARRRPTC